VTHALSSPTAGTLAVTSLLTPRLGSGGHSSVTTGQLAVGLSTRDCLVLVKKAFKLAKVVPD
jgi:hypothetical protein